MKIVDLQYQSKYFPHLNNAKRDEYTFYKITHTKRGDRSTWAGIVKTLSGYGNEINEIVAAILKYNTCNFTDENLTRAMVEKFVSTGTNKEQKLYKEEKTIIEYPCESAIKPLAFKDSHAYLLYFLQYYAIPKEVIPANLREAAYYYISRGRIALPRYKQTKRVYLNHRLYGVDRFKWKYGDVDYSKLIMTRNDIYDSWDYSNGICLIVPTDWRDDVYLDIDMRSDKHPLGLEKLDESILQGYHWERTQNGGYHVFGKGRPQKPPIPSEIQIVSTLIVTFPTNGYSLK